MNTENENMKGADSNERNSTNGNWENRNSDYTDNEEETDENGKHKACPFDRANDILNTKYFTAKQKKELKELIKNMYNKSIELAAENNILQNLLKDKIDHMEERIVERIQRQKNEGTIPTSYASIAANKNTPKQVTQFKIVVKPKNKQESDETKQQIKEQVDPVTRKIGINGLKRARNGQIEIYLPTETDKNKIKAILTKDQKLEVEEKKRNNPRLIIDNIDMELEKDEEIIQTMLEQNDNINGQMTYDEFRGKTKIRTHIKSKYREGTKRVIMEVTADLRRIMIQDKINIGWRRGGAKDYLTGVQCYNCCGIGHTSKHCNTITTCGNCAGQHTTGECREEIAFCILCHIENERYGKNINTYHICRDGRCETIERIKTNIKKSIDY